MVSLFLKQCVEPNFFFKCLYYAFLQCSAQTYTEGGKKHRCSMSGASLTQCVLVLPTKQQRQHILLKLFPVDYDSDKSSMDCECVLGGFRYHYSRRRSDLGLKSSRVTEPLISPGSTCTPFQPALAMTQSNPHIWSP